VKVFSVVGLDPGALEAPCAVATPACRFDSRERVLRCA